MIIVIKHNTVAAVYWIIISFFQLSTVIVMSSHRRHSFKLFKARCRTTRRQNSFHYIRVISEWNKVPQEGIP